MDKFKIDNQQELILRNGRWVLHVNGQAQEVLPESLYKYYPLNEYSLDSLENGYFYLNNPRDFNDPFDCNYNLITENQQDLQDWDYVPLLNDVVNRGISCFTENGLSPLMWAHYTNAYNGFVIKIKPNFSFRKTPQFYSAKLLSVIYSNYPNSVPQNAPFANQYQLIIKLNDWKYENEWRLIVDKNHSDFNKLFYDSSTIEEISFGYKLHQLHDKKYEKLQSRLDEIIKKKFIDLPLFSVGPHQKEFKLQKMPFKYGKVSDIFPDFQEKAFEK